MQLNCKELIGKKAATLVQNNTVVGLGTGSTSAYFIQSLAQKIQEEKLTITAVATSYKSEQLAKSLHIPCVSIDSVSHIDIAFDGADEIDSKRRLIKGAGGALLREKIIAKASKELVILAEESKFSEYFCKSKLPVEIVQFGHLFTVQALKNMGYQLEIRKNQDGSLFITDNNNLIYDITFSSPRTAPEEDDRKIRSVTGVVDTGFFFNLTGRIVMGKSDGTVVIL